MADVATHVDADPQQSKVRAEIGVGPLAALVALIIAGDQLIWAVLPGISLPVFLLAVAAACHTSSYRLVALKPAVMAWVVLCVSLIPSIDLVQPLSIAFALAGMLGFVGIMIGEHGRAALCAALRFPFYGAIGVGYDAITLATQPRGARSSTLVASLRDWIIPTGLGALFAALLLVANPVLEQWVTQLISFDGTLLPTFGQFLFWCILAALIWPFLRLTLLRPMLTQPTPEIRTFGQVWYLSPRSVTRALILFNLMFAAQTATDLAVLWGDVSLPEGMTYAIYAHRGAYPLLCAALFAGGFALLTQPFLIGRPLLRVLLLVWVAQTALLVASSMLRLDLYIEAYSLTRLRFAAFIWMGVTGGGLILMIWQLLRGFGPGWLMMRATELGVITLYVCCLVNVDGLVARHNLQNNDTELDFAYMCKLGEGATVAIAEIDARNMWPICSATFGPELTEPKDWREWGYRNARLRTNLAKIEGTVP